MQTIDYDAIEKNALFFKNLIGKSKLCAVLKNNAYGHGIVHVARHIAPLIDCFAVGSVDEAEQLLFSRKDILILLPQNERNAVRAIKSNCILTVDSFDTLELIKKLAQRLNVTVRIHLKIDSGMSRLGFKYADIDELIHVIQGSKVAVEGIFSHFYGEIESECDTQLQTFRDCFVKVEQGIGSSLIKHIANTNAVLLSPRYHLDMVRVGLGLYGYSSELLLPAKSVYADVISVKRVVAGSVGGYGAIYKCAADTNIAVINVGYATGLPRILRGSEIKIGCNYHPIVAICMAMSLVDVGDDIVKVGDTAMLLGKDVNIANDQVIIYELLCNLK